MHVLLVIDSLAGGGAQRQLVNLAVGLAARGHAVRVLTYAPLEHHLPTLHAADVAYDCVGKRHRFDLRPALALWRVYRRARPDVVVAFLRTPVVYAELARVFAPSMRLIVSERSGVARGGLSGRDRLAGLGHALATHVTANSEDYLRRLVDALPFLAGRSSVIRNGIEERFFALGRERLDRSAATTPTATRAAPTPGDPPPRADDATTLRFCVVAARVSEEKGGAVLADALVLLAGRGLDGVHVDWIGPVDPDAAAVRAIDARLDAAGLAGHWRWRGAFDDVGRAFAEQDALLLPSLYEGAANTLCEAMCAGLPVVATDVADNRDVLEAGRAGLLCRPADAGSLADAIARFAALAPEARRALAERAFRRAESLFAMKRFVDRWEALCRRVSDPDAPADP